METVDHKSRKRNERFDFGGNAVPDGGKPTPPTPEPPAPAPKPKAWHVITFAGGSGSSNADGIGAAASFNTPFFIIQSGTTLYTADGSSNSLRSIDTTTARVGTLVKGNIIGGHANGVGDAAAAGTQARFNAPRGVAAAGAGTLYVADSNNHRIRKVTIGAAAAATQVSDFAGSGAPGYANGAGADARFNSPGDLAVSGDTLYVADINNHRIRAVDIPSGVVSDVAGSGTAGHADGAGADARFSSPTGIAVNVSGSTLYVTTINAGLIRKLEYREVGL